MKTFVLSLVAAVFAGLEAFGVQVPAEIKQVVSDNTNLVIAGLAALIGAWPQLVKLFKSAKAPGTEGGFIDRQMVFAIAIATTVALLSGCASFGRVEAPLSTDQRIAAVLVAATEIRAGCADFYEQNRLSIPDALVCLEATDVARNAVDIARLASKRGEANDVLENLQKAEQIIRALQRGLAEAAATPVPAPNPGVGG